MRSNRPRILAIESLEPGLIVAATPVSRIRAANHGSSGSFSNSRTLQAHRPNARHVAAPVLLSLIDLLDSQTAHLRRARCSRPAWGECTTHRRWHPVREEGEERHASDLRQGFAPADLEAALGGNVNDVAPLGALDSLVLGHAAIASGRTSLEPFLSMPFGAQRGASAARARREWKRSAGKRQATTASRAERQPP